jgi:hypothetical protein
MDVKESNQGFIDLHTPMGLLLLVFAFLALVAFILAGAAFFKFGQERDRQGREELKRRTPPPTP